MRPAEVIRVIKTSRLRGRGGAGFPCGMKWEFARAAEGDRKIVICNADEGEPGTFKDRVLLTELADRIFAGMTIAGYAIGAAEGIVYLRAEYAYLRRFLENALAIRRRDGWLGKRIAGKPNCDFDIRIQLGAGAYVCGEETALISSAEGRRGEPKNRPPFPAQSGYLGCPTIVNNCETLCCVTKILEEGPATFQELGTQQTSGTKLLSVSGDCARPGVYEFDFGVTLRHVLETAGAKDPQAVQVGGPSGELMGPEQFDRIICFDDLGTGGAIMCFDQSRDLLEIVHAFMEFFVEESCGYCTPCRVGNSVLLEGVRRVRAGRGQPSDLAQFEQVGRMMKACSRCGLGQTSWRPVVTSLQNFRSHYESLVQDDPHGYQRSFDLKEAVAGAERLTGRKSIYT
jgi:[NiFe] hydrogenase diaphorase moiety large subunit